MPDKKGDEEREVRKPKKKYTRREAIKYGAKIGFGAALWGTAGNLLGRGYEYGRDFYRNEVKPTLDTVKKGVDKVGEWGDDLNRTFNPWYEPKKEVKKEPEKVTRRRFLKSLAWQAHEHPVAAGTAVGTTYGAVKHALTGLSRYLTKSQIAKLKDKNTDYEERIHILEEYQAGLEQSMKEKDVKVDKLQAELEEVKEIMKRLKKPSGLEEKASEGSTTEESKEVFLALGISGLFVSIMLGSVSITGNVLLDATGRNALLLSIVLFFISLLVVFIGIRKR